jgi:hypothetical protein
MSDSPQYLMIGGDGRQYGPMDAAGFKSWIQEGRAVASTQVQVVGTHAWRPLGEIAELGPLPPSAYAPLMGVQAPASIRVFGILYLVFGGMGMLCAPFSLLGMAPIAAMFGDNPFAITFFTASTLLSIVSSGVMLGAGVGLVRQREWGRRLAVVYAWVAIVLGVVSSVITVALMTGRVGSAPEMVGGLIGGVIGGLLNLAFNGVTIYFLTRPAVRDFLAARARLGG